MTPRNGLERDLAVWFSETATPQLPVYLDHILQQTARSRQRPGWTFLERYLPMTATATARAAAMGVPWRRLGLLLLVLLAIAAALIVAGGRRNLPAPFGPAAPGLIAYSADGDIFTVRRATGETRGIVTGPTHDTNPEWSRDGTRLVFQRPSETGAHRLLFVVNADGTGLKQITPSPVELASDVTGPDYRFSPDGTEVAFMAQGRRLHIARTDGSGMRDLSPLDGR